jgi:hypothetical protein
MNEMRVVEPHHYYAALAPGKIFSAPPAALAPTSCYLRSQNIKINENMLKYSKIYLKFITKY